MAKTQGSETSFDSVLQEERVFPPPKSFSESAWIGDLDIWRRLSDEARSDRGAFFGKLAQELLVWRRPFTKALEGKLPDARWFVDGELNATETCIDRHLSTWRRNKAAIIWEGEPGDERVLTYNELAREVGRFANGLRSLGVEKGDRVCLYLPMIPEAAIAMLACARIGATHTVVFAGFSAEALRDRINDTGAKVVVTADGFFRKGNVVKLKSAVDEALKGAPCVRKVVVARRANATVSMSEGRDLFWQDLVAEQPDVCKAEPVWSEHPLFVLYTSGSTGKPKGVVHGTAGFLLGAALTSRWVFDLKDEDTWWCTADVGWVTGHTYAVYGPLALGATVVMYEGAPLSPAPDRFWRIIEKHHVTAFYTAPTAIRTFLRLGTSWPEKHDLSSLRLLGSVGEPINPEAWMWYREVIGKNRCPVVDTWWQTETGAAMIAPLPGATPTKPGSATLPLPGISARIVDEGGKDVPAGKGGYLVIDEPWPWMSRTLYGDRERFLKSYFSQYPGWYTTGDGARQDEDGYFWIMGRVDDVINVAGHRLGTMEIESALVAADDVAEAAVVGTPDPVKGTAIVAFVTLRQGVAPSPVVADSLRAHVSREIGAIARPDQIRFADALPKTRSGKIMRRFLRDLAAGREAQGDMSTLEDIGVLASLHEGDEE
ncbi:acetate--CoA ligase [Vulgatibacter incomptus]|uniref:Acetyl-coenzyme A synthetase n=1 Tax=Vulgatibacter incomptus TaxID=1391653 RepID=A0A0K1P9F4_9BACT|nr:acetate--CoA ligase [Vulgatibacter incomptus]AKU90056.1 Acetyl-coenzyme A synthetase [Vulgatibacter incomptus]